MFRKQVKVWRTKPTVEGRPPKQEFYATATSYDDQGNTVTHVITDLPDERHRAIIAAQHKCIRNRLTYKDIHLIKGIGKKQGLKSGSRTNRY